MNNELYFNTDLKVAGLAPLKLVGRCHGHEFTILEVDDGYLLIDSDGFDDSFFTVKEALAQCWLNWG